MLFDPVKMKLTGILDWSHSWVSDPALDFSHLFEINWNLREQVLKKYDRDKSGFETRIDSYVKTEHFYEAMWGVEHGIEQAKTQGLRRLRRRIASNDANRL